MFREYPCLNEHFEWNFNGSRRQSVPKIKTNGSVRHIFRKQRWSVRRSLHILIELLPLELSARILFASHLLCQHNPKPSLLNSRSISQVGNMQYLCIYHHPKGVCRATTPMPTLSHRMLLAAPTQLVTETNSPYSAKQYGPAHEVSMARRTVAKT